MMKHLILALATTTLLLFSTTTTTTNANTVYDTFGDPLVAGNNYYIVPYNYAKLGGGFSWIERRQLFTPCPEFYVNQVEDNTDFGQPTSFIPIDGNQNMIAVSSKVNIVFPEVSPPASLPIFCDASTNVWKVVKDKDVMLRGKKGASDPNSVFTIKEMETGFGYGIYFCDASGSKCSGLGIDPKSNDRRLIVNGTEPLAIVFESDQYFLKKYAKYVA